MKHLRYFLLAALVAMPLTACDEDSDPVVDILIGTVAGTVSAEGTGLAGVGVTLVGAVSQSATTGAGGTYAFANVPAGSYGVSIDASTQPDVSFSQTSKSTTITTDGETATVDFSGSYIKTAAITGLVTSSGAPLGGVAVRVTGGPGNITDNSVTSAGGEYRATGLRKGTYTVTITPPAGTTFTTVAAQVTLATGETRSAHFPGTAIQLATISGAVTVGNVGQAGVAVALSGGAVKTTETGVGGAYSFTNLTPGAYTVTITAPDDVTFPVLFKAVTVAAGENGVANFAGKGPDTPARISINSITTGAGVPVVLTNVSGQIEVTLNITRGDKPLDKVDVTFTNAGGTPIVLATQKIAVLAPAEAAPGDQEVITLNVPTNQIRMGDSTYVPVIFNGKANISANLWEVGAEAPIPTNEVPVVMNNPDVLMTSNGMMIPGVVTRNGAQATDIVTGVGLSWNTGGLMYTGPIYISFSTTVQTARWAAGLCLNGVGAVAGTAATGITLSNTWTCAGVEAQNQGPAGSLPVSYTGVVLGPDGTAVTLPTAWSALGANFTLAGEDRWFVLTPGPAGLTAPAVFDIDNVGPTITTANGAAPGTWGVAFNPLFDQPWINATYNFLQDGTWVDGGVGVDLTTRHVHLWDAVPTVPVCDTATVIVTGDDLAETVASDGTPDGYRICSSGADLLGNVGVNSGPSNWFGVDKVAPLWRFHGTTAATPALAGTLPTVSATPNTTIYNILSGAPYVGDVWGLEGLDMRAGFNQNAVTGFPASQKLTRQTGLVNATDQVPGTGAAVGPSAMTISLSDTYVRTATEWAFHDAFALPGYYSYTGYVTDRAGNSTTPYVRNWLTDDVTAPTITFATFAAICTDCTGGVPYYAPGYPAGFVIFGADDLEVITASFTMDYPTISGPFGLLYDFAVGQRWDGLNPYDALAFTTAITGVSVQVPSLVGRVDFTCSGAAAPYASCAATDALPVTLTEFTAVSNVAMLPVSLTPISFEDAGGNLSGGAAPVLFNVLQFNDSTAAPWDYANEPDIDFWRILTNGATAFSAQHTASTSIEDPFFDSVKLVLNDAGTLITCGTFGVPVLTDNGINRFWTSGIARPAATSQCGKAQIANAAATYHAVGVSGNAWLVSQGIL